MCHRRVQVRGCGSGASCVPARDRDARFCPRIPAGPQQVIVCEDAKHAAQRAAHLVSWLYSSCSRRPYASTACWSASYCVGVTLAGGSPARWWWGGCWGWWSYSGSASWGPQHPHPIPVRAPVAIHILVLPPLPLPLSLDRGRDPYPGGAARSQPPRRPCASAPPPEQLPAVQLHAEHAPHARSIAQRGVHVPARDTLQCACASGLSVRVR